MDRRVLTYKGSEHVKIIHRPYILNKKRVSLCRCLSRIFQNFLKTDTQ